MNYGALAGLATGVARYGEDMVRGDEFTRRLVEQEASRLRLQDDRQAASQTQLEERLAARLGAGAGGGRAGAGPSMGALDIARNPEAMALLGGIPREDANDYLSMAQGKDPGATVHLDPARFDSADRAAESQPQDVQVQKYTPGAAAELRARASNALREAMKVANPGQADDLSKSQATDRTGALVTRYANGDDRAGDAALISQGKDPQMGDAAMTRAEKGPAARGSGSNPATTVQKTLTDNEGNVVVVFRDGTTKTLGIKASDYGKRVDALAKNLAKTIEFMGKPFGDVRAAAEAQIAAGGAAHLSPSPAPAPAQRPPLTSFMK